MRMRLGASPPRAAPLERTAAGLTDLEIEVYAAEIEAYMKWKAREETLRAGAPRRPFAGAVADEGEDHPRAAEEVAAASRLTSSSSGEPPRRPRRGRRLRLGGAPRRDAAREVRARSRGFRHQSSSKPLADRTPEPLSLVGARAPPRRARPRRASREARAPLPRGAGRRRERVAVRVAPGGAGEPALHLRRDAQRRRVRAEREEPAQREIAHDVGRVAPLDVGALGEPARLEERASRGATPSASPRTGIARVPRRAPRPRARAPTAARRSCQSPAPPRARKETRAPDGVRARPLRRPLRVVDPDPPEVEPERLERELQREGEHARAEEAVPARRRERRGGDRRA